MCAIHLLIMFYISVKFHQICFSSLSFAETRFVTDGRTDERKNRRTDGAILICLPKSLRRHKNKEKWLDKVIFEAVCFLLFS